MSSSQRSTPGLLGQLCFLCLALAIMLLLVCLFAGALQRRLYYAPKSPRKGPTPSNVGIRYWPVAIEDRIDAWWMPSPPNAPTVLICHGNAGDMSSRLPLLSIIQSAGYGALLFDYSGYGNTPGVPSEDTLVADGRSAWTWLEKRIGARNIILLGRSMGGAVAAAIASQCFTSSNRPRALILDSTFTTLPQACLAHFPRWLQGPITQRFLDLIVTDKHPTLYRINSVAQSIPVVICHTTVDRVAPFSHALANAAAGNCPLITLPLGGHNDSFMRSDTLYRRILLAAGQGHPSRAFRELQSLTCTQHEGARP